MESPKVRTPFFLGCEGKSEEIYGQLIQSYAWDIGLHVTFPPYKCNGGSPLVVATRSIAESINRDSKFRPIKAKFLLVDSDKLDDMKKDDITKMKELLIANKFVTIWQKYNHEGFLLRHFKGHENDCPPKGQSLKALQKVWPNYEKGKMTLRDYRDNIKLDDIKRASGNHPRLRSFLKTIGLVV